VILFMGATQGGQGYRPEIDGLRAIAVIAVIINHFNRELLPGGHLGVDIFFVISGYVITASLGRQNSSTFSEFIASFYARRIKRLLPALLVSGLVSALLICLINPKPDLDIKTGISSLFGAANLWLYGQSTNYFDKPAELNIFTQTWSLGVEEQFYFVFPLLVWLSGFSRSMKNGRRNLAVATSILLTASLLLYAYLSRTNQSAAFYLMPSRFWELSAGCLSLLAITQWPQLKEKLRWIPPALAVGLIIFILSHVVKTRESIGIVALTSLLLVRLQPSDWTYRILCTSIMQWMGKISYSLYLWHWIILVFSRWTIGIHAWTIPIQVGLIVGIASLSYYCVEKTFRHASLSSTNLWTILSGLGGMILGSAFMMVALIPGLSIYTGNRKGVLSKDQEIQESYRVKGTTGLWTGKPCIHWASNDLDKTMDIANCTLGNFSTAKRRILVVGNSFSASFTHAFDQMIQKDQYAIVITSTFGAGATPGIKLKKGFDELSNDYWTRIVPAISKRLKPGDFILMINDLQYFSPIQQDQESQDFLHIFELEISQFSNQMKAKGIPILFLRGLPFAREAKCEPAVAAKQWFNQIGAGPCEYFTKKNTLNRMKPLNRVLDRLEQRHIIKTIDLMPIFCPGETCNYNGPGGIILYRDSQSHPTVEAAELSSKIFREAIINP
jgi:peptidoglycan/LPS O-acetylase OafA/YrhL